MMTLPSDLTQLIEILKEIRQVDCIGSVWSNVDMEQKAKLRKGRAAVVQIIGKIFSDVTKTKGLKNLDEKMADVCHTVLQYIAHCVQHFPLLFIPPSYGFSLTDSHKMMESVEEEKFCQAMIIWIIAKLLGLLSSARCEILHQNAEMAILRLLNLVKLKDPFNFQLLLADLLLCLGDSLRAFESFYEDSTTDNAWKVSQLGGQMEALDFGDCHLSFDGLVVENARNCELLQMALTRMITSLVGGAWLAEVALYDVLWMTIVCQLENGGVPLKGLSVSAMICLVKEHNLPHPQALDYVMSTLNAMFMFLTCDHIVPRDSDLTLNFGRLYTSILETSTISTCVYSIQNTRLVEGLEEIVSVIHQHGTQVYSREMWHFIDESLSLIYRLLPHELMRANTVASLRRFLGEALVTDVGLVENGQVRTRPCA